MSQPMSMPSSTPAERPYDNLINSSQYARNNFLPTKRQFKRVVSPQEKPPVLKLLLHKYWGFTEFRHPQLEICTQAMFGSDLLVVAPTGLGKSLCFQLPAITIEHGVTIVVSPLLSLMADQVNALKQKGIKVAMLNQDVPEDEVREVRHQMRIGHPIIRLLYVTPEALLSPRYQDMFRITHDQKQLVRLVIDEAHTITEWGKSFRPLYRDLGKFRERFPDVPVTALTASATREVRDDIIKVLRIEKGYGQWVMPFNRRNLYYSVRYKGRGAEDEDLDPETSVIDDIGDWIEAYRPQAKKRNEKNGIFRPCVTGLVYCRTKKACDETAAALCDRGIKAATYYQAIRGDEKRARMHGWNVGTIECIVATIAFGMGVDQPNVRYVIHYDMPKSFEGYYQETGRAGRDGHISHCLTFYSREDAGYVRGLVQKEENRQKRSAGDEMDEVDNDDITPRSASMRSLKWLQHCLESTKQCRHIGICRYFGEGIDDTNKEELKSYCEEMCDVCRHPADVKKRALRLTVGLPGISQLEPLSRALSPDLSRDAPSSEPSVPNSLAELHGDMQLADDDEAVPAPIPGSSRPPNTGTHLLGNPAPGPSRPFKPPSSVRLPATSSGTSQPSSGPAPSRTPRLERQNRPLSSSRNPSSSTVGGESKLNSSIASRSASASSSPAVATIRPGSAVSTPSAPNTPRLERITPQSPKSIFQPIRIRDVPTPDQLRAPPRPPSPSPSLRPRSRSPLPPANVDADAAPSRHAPAKRRRERETTPRGVRYINDSEEGPASELKLTREQRVRAEKMLRSVDPATAEKEGPYACYNGTTPLKARNANATTTGSVKRFRPPIIKSPSKVRCEALTKSSRDNAVIAMIESLQTSLAHGELARRVMTAWGRRENGSKRKKVINAIVMGIERDIADVARDDSDTYNRRVSEFRKATKALRSPEVVQAIIEGDLDSFDDGGEEIKVLKRIQRRFIGYIDIAS